MSKVKFSIIVPIYKVEKYLDKCIQSILNQTYKNFELLLINDGSPDNCPKMCDEYAKKDDRVKVIHKKNGGLVSARNIGVENSIGDYICYVDGDDWIKENLLEVVINKAINEYHPDMVVYSAVRQYDDKQIEIPYDIPEGLYNKKKLESDIYPYMMYDPRKSFCTGLIFPVAWNKIYRTDILKKHYCKDERIRMGEDNAFVFECLYNCNSIYFCNDILYYYNQLNSGSMTNNYDSNRFENNKYLTTYIDEKIGGIDNAMDFQIKSFKVYWLIMAVFHEVKCKRPLLKSSKHIKKEIKRNESLKGITLKGLPFSAKMYLILLKLHFYYLALVLAKVLSKWR